VTYDLITVGRVNMDLYAQDIGAAFEDVTGFDAMVGGSPSNIAIATSRLGLRSIAFTGVGDDRVGDYVLRYLRDEGVITDFVCRKSGKLTSLALLGVQPPDHFPLSFYREDPADIHLTVEDAEALPFDQTQALLLSGNTFSRGTCADAGRYCGEEARRQGLTTFMDLDLRPTDWTHQRAYGLTLRSVFPLVDVIIGTEEEFFAALAPAPDSVLAGDPVGEAELETLDGLIEQVIESGTCDTIVLKRGPRGVAVLSSSGRLDVPSFSVEVVNTVGAGDAFAAGLIRSRLTGWDWYRSARFANACGAIQVIRHGCSGAFPTEAEVTEFAEKHGGL
jgi:5-dehydro-2-deoxygluconokinase